MSEKQNVVWGKPHFSIPADRTVGERYNRVSCVMIDVAVPIVGTGMRIKTAIYANLNRKSDGVSVEPSAYIPKKFLVQDTEGGRDALAAHIENAAIKWPGYEAAYDETAKALLGYVDGKASPAAVKTAQRPTMSRLLKAGKVVATAPANSKAPDTSTQPTGQAAA